MKSATSGWLRGGGVILWMYPAGVRRCALRWMSQVRPSCHTGAVNWGDEGIGRAAWGALRRRTGTSPQLSRWTWAADVALALAMAGSTLNSGYHHVDNSNGHGPRH